MPVNLRQYTPLQKTLLLACGFAGLAYLLLEARGEGDFHIYMSAARDLFSGVNIYEKAYGNGFHYLYSVFFAIVLYPFSFLPFYLVKLCWLLLNAFLLYKTYRLLFSYFDRSALSNKQRMMFYTVVLLFSARFIHENFHTGQITILILYTCVQGLHMVFYTPSWPWGCVLIALGINIKLLPLVLLPYLLYRGRFKAFAGTILIAAFFWLFPALVTGISKNTFLMQEWWARMNPSNALHVLDVSERSFHSLTTLLSTLFVAHVPDLYALPLRRHIADVSLHTLGLIITISRAVLIGGTLYFLRSLPFRNAADKTQQYTEVAYILAIIPLIFPHQQHYAFLFTVPAAMHVIYFTIRYYQVLRPAQRIFLLAGGIFVYLCCNLKLILGEFNAYYEHYKILSYGALWLLVLLAYTRTRKNAQLDIPS